MLFPFPQEVLWTADNNNNKAIIIEHVIITEGNRITLFITKITINIKNRIAVLRRVRDDSINYLLSVTGKYILAVLPTQYIKERTYILYFNLNNLTDLYCELCHHVNVSVHVHTTHLYPNTSHLAHLPKAIWGNSVQHRRTPNTVGHMTVQRWTHV